jgi:FkbM family methyltransferase
MRALVKPGDTVIDVGANIGYFAIIAARAAGPAGQVHAFEPVESIRRSLVANLQLNGITDVRVHHEALSNTAGETTFYLGPDQDTGLGSLRQLSTGVSIRVQQACFDDWWTRPSRVGLVKIDVEGAELRVLEGMTQCLVRDRPDILLEVTDAYLEGLGASAEELIALLKDHGYQVFEIPEDGPLVALNDAADLARCPSQFNALCTHKDIATLRL